MSEADAYIHALVGTFELTNLGRSKANVTVKIRGEKDLWRTIQPFLASRDIEYEYDAETNVGKIFVGGFRHVGDFRRISE